MSLSLTVFGKVFQVCRAEKWKTRLAKSIWPSGSDSCVLVVELSPRTVACCDVVAHVCWHRSVIVSEMTYNVSMGTLNPTMPCHAMHRSDADFERQDSQLVRDALLDRQPVQLTE